MVLGLGSLWLWLLLLLLLLLAIVVGNCLYLFGRFLELDRVLCKTPVLELLLLY